jgi:hypothetical protein
MQEQLPEDDSQIIVQRTHILFDLKSNLQVPNTLNLTVFGLSWIKRARFFCLEEMIMLQKEVSDDKNSDLCFMPVARNVMGG